MNMFQQGAFQVKPGTSPEQLEKRRQIISQMLSGTGSARYAGEGLANLATNVAGGIQRRNLDNYETGQRNSAAESVTQAPNSSAQDLRALLSNPWLSSQQKQMVAKQLQQAEVRAASAAGAPGYSRGTESARGGTAIVGENGPEVVQMPKGAKVIPNNQLAELVTDQNGIMRYNEPVQPDDYFRNELGEDKYQRYLRMDDAGRLEYLNDPANGFLPYGHGDSYDPNPIDPRSIFDTNNRFNDAASYQTADMSGIDASQLPYGDEKLTGDQSKAIAYYRRGFGANQSLSDPVMEEALTQYTDTFAKNFGGLGRAFQDADFQVANRAADEFLAAILRKDTGAAVTKQEFDLYAPMYLPQPGDKPELLAAKRKAREEALTAIEMGLGSAAALAAKTRQELGNSRNVSEMSDEDLLKQLTGR